MLLTEVGVHVGQDGGIGDRLDQSAAEHRSGNAEDEIVFLRRLREVVLGDVAARRVGAPGDGEQVMDAAVHVLQIEGVREARFAHRAVDRNERRHLVGRALIGGVGHLRIDGRAGAAHGRLGVALRAALRVESRSQTVARVLDGAGDRIDLQKVRLPGAEESQLILCETGNRRTGSGRPAAHPGISCAVSAGALGQLAPPPPW